MTDRRARARSAAQNFCISSAQRLIISLIHASRDFGGYFGGGGGVWLPRARGELFPSRGWSWRVVPSCTRTGDISVASGKRECAVRHVDVSRMKTDFDRDVCVKNYFFNDLFFVKGELNIL